MDILQRNPAALSNKVCLLIISILVFDPNLAKTGGPPTYSTELEEELRDSLYSNYQILQRPAQTVRVNVALNLLSIRYLDIKEQNMAISAYFTLEWYDKRLRWIDNSTYSNIPFIFSTEAHTWRPAVIVENSVKDIDVISKPNVLMRVIGSGVLLWTPGGVYVTYCESDVTYYPLDTQSCDIILSTWSYTANEVSLGIWEDGIIMEYFQEHGEWEVIGFKNTSTSLKREKQSFSRLRFTLTLRRRPLFHVLNTIFPVILMAFLTVIVFKLPVESGERIGLSLTVLLAYAVYLTLISDNIPQTSLSASLLSSYLAIILLFSTCSVILTIFILDVYFTPEEKEIPHWLQILTKRVLSRIVCWKRPSTLRPSDLSADGPTANHNQAAVDLEHPCPTPKKKIASKKYPSVVRVTPVAGSGLDVMEEEYPDDSSSFRSYSGDENEVKKVEEEGDYSWKDIAMIIDKIFLYLFLVLVTVTTVACMAVLVFHYTADYTQE